MAHSRLSTILHRSSAARVGMDQPRLRQISNIARKILHKQNKLRYIRRIIANIPASRLLYEDHIRYESKA